MSEPTKANLLSALATAGSTDGLIDWDALQVHEWPCGLTEQDRCQLLLDLANGADLPPARWNSFVGGSVISSPAPIKLTPYDRQGVTASLRLRIEGTSQQVKENARFLAEVASRCVVIVPVLSASSRDERILARHMRSAIAYALWLFYDDSRGFGPNLCRCGLKSCGKFFFKRAARGGVGAPRRSYCSPRHAKAADSAAAAARMQRIRRQRS